MKKKKSLPAVVVLVSAMFICLAIDFITNGMLNNWFGIVPRDTDYLLGILMHPFVHSGLGHFTNNIIALAILGFFLRLFFSDNQMYFVFFLLAILGGIFTWLFAGEGLHIGASGVTFGMKSALLTLAIKKRSLKGIIVGIMIIIMYGTSLITGIIPREGISFEGHLFGIIAGILVALFFIRFEKKNEVEHQEKSLA